MQSLTIRRPDDWHLHVRDHSYLKDTLPASTAHFQRALLMPNLIPPLITTQDIEQYKKRVSDYIPTDFTPFFTLYLTEETEAEDLEQAAKSSDILGAKLYPKGATTHSDAGISSLKKLYPLLEIMQTKDLVLQIHGESVTDDIFHREKTFIENDLMPLTKAFPKLRIVLEHISTKAACDFVSSSPTRIAATITIHHLLYNRNHMLSGGIKPHLYCLPILKSETNQKAIQAAALSGDPSFFLGTDSAPHGIEDKESSCGCAGIYSAPYALPLYASFFDKHDRLNKLESFAAHYGADFYGLPRNDKTITLTKKPQTIPTSLRFGDKTVKPIAAGESIDWSVEDD